MSSPPRTTFTRDGRDGFPAEQVFDAQVDEYINALNPRKREKALVRFFCPFTSSRV